MMRSIAFIIKSGVVVGSTALLVVPMGISAPASAASARPADLCIPVVGDLLGTCPGGDGTAAATGTAANPLPTDALPSIANVNLPVDVCGIAAGVIGDAT